MAPPRRLRPYWCYPAALLAIAHYHWGGMRCFPFADEPELPVDGDVRLVAKERDSEIAGWHGSIILMPRLRELQRPACMPVLMRQRWTPFFGQVSKL